MIDQVLRKPDVEQATGFCERQLREMEREGDFPRRFPLNPNGKGRAVGWLASEVQEWIKQRAAAR